MFTPDTSGPMVAALPGVLIWKEVRGANSTARGSLAATFVFSLLALSIVARAGDVAA